MARPATGRPTDLELEILKVLWELGPATVRQVMETMLRRRPIGYTTVLKMLQIMTTKTLVHCDKSARVHVYRARHTKRVTVRKLTADLLERVCEGSTQTLLLHALEVKRVKPEELAQIRALLDELELKQK